MPYPLDWEEDRRYEEVDKRPGIDQRSKAAYLKAWRLSCLARWSGAIGRPLKIEARLAACRSQKIADFVHEHQEKGRFCGSAINGLARYYFAARFAVTPYAIPEVD